MSLLDDALLDDALLDDAMMPGAAAFLAEKPAATVDRAATDAGARISTASQNAAQTTAQAAPERDAQYNYA